MHSSLLELHRIYSIVQTPRSQLTFIQIDAAAVGEALGYTNTKSVANRISNLKKKYNLPFTTGSSKGATAKVDANALPSSPKAATATAAEPKVPATPSKKRVSKRVAAKKAAAPKAAKSPKGKTKAKAKVAKTEDAEVVKNSDGGEDADGAEDGSGVEGDDELPDTPAKSDEATIGNAGDTKEIIEVEA